MEPRKELAKGHALAKPMFNLIVTHEPGPQNYRYVLSVVRSIIPGAVLVDTGPAVILLRVEDPYAAVSALRERREELNMIYRVIPVDATTQAYVEDVAEEAAGLAEERIPRDKTYRITLRGRLFWRETRLPAHSLDAIRVIAGRIARSVSLTSPDYLVYIRSLRLYRARRVAAITVARPSDILSLASGKP